MTELQKLMSFGGLWMFGGHVWSVASCPGFEQVPSWQLFLAGTACVAAGLAMPFILVRTIQFTTNDYR